MFFLVRMHWHKKWGESRIPTTSRVGIFAITVDGFYPLTAAAGSPFEVM